MVGRRTPWMKTQMKTLTKTIFGIAMLAGSALAIATPANAQSGFGFYFGNPVAQRFHVDRDDYRGGFLRLDPYLHRQVLDSSRGSYHRRGLGPDDPDYDPD